MATGLLLGQDLRTRILSNLGPGLVAYLDSPVEPTAGAGQGLPAGRGSMFPVVVAIGLSQGSAGGARIAESDAPAVTLAAALDNGLRTLIALTALDEKRGDGRSQIATRNVAGATVTTLDVPIPFAYAVDRMQARLVMGTSAGAVARYLENSVRSPGGPSIP